MTNEQYHKLKNRAAELTERYHHLMTMEQTPIIQDIIGEYMEEAERITNLISTKREYLYNFKSGGWNSEYAFTSNLAYAQAMERWGDDPKLQIDPQSFRVSTPADMQAALSLFY